MRLKVILINLLLLFLIYACIDFAIYNCAVLKIYFNNSKIMPLNKYHIIYNKRYLNYKYSSFDEFYENNVHFRPVAKNQYNKNPVLIFGCSFAYGEALNDEQTFSYKLSQYTKRPVYNRGYLGWGIQDMLYQLRRKDFYNNIKEPEYIIYTYIGAHAIRLYSETGIINPQIFYTETAEGLKENKFYTTVNPFYNYVIKGIHLLYYSKQSNILPPKQTIPLINKYFIESKKIADKHWQNTKFVILVYSDQGYEDWKYLEKEGFIVIKVKELTKENISDLKYQISKLDTHPSEKAWDLIVPLLSKKLNI